MSHNALSRKVNGNGKVILDTHPESDQHQNWTCSTGSPPAPTHQIWWWSMNPFLRYLADKHSAHRQTHVRRWPQDLAAYGAQVIIIIVEASNETDKRTAWAWRKRLLFYTVTSLLPCPSFTACRPADQTGLLMTFPRRSYVTPDRARSIACTLSLF